MFKTIKAAAQLRAAQAEIRKLKSAVGEGPKSELENEEMDAAGQGIERVTITQRLEAIENMEMERILGGGF